jgi:hypothetical protein
MVYSFLEIPGLGIWSGALDIILEIYSKKIASYGNYLIDRGEVCTSIYPPFSPASFLHPSFPPSPSPFLHSSIPPFLFLLPSFLPVNPNQICLSSVRAFFGDLASVESKIFERTHLIRVEREIFVMSTEERQEKLREEHHEFLFNMGTPKSTGRSGRRGRREGRGRRREGREGWGGREREGKEEGEGGEGKGQRLNSKN